MFVEFIYHCMKYHEISWGDKNNNNEIQLSAADTVKSIAIVVVTVLVINPQN